jgi:histone H3/H4
MEQEDANEEVERREEAAAPRPYWGPNAIFGHLALDYQANLELKTEYLRAFWKAQVEEVKQTVLPRAQILPPKRIRHIVKREDDVIESRQRIAKEVVELFGKAAELFISELSLAAWMNVAANKKVIKVRDLSTAVQTFHSFDFLEEFVPTYEARTKRVKKRATTTAPAEAVAEPSNGHFETESAPQTQETELETQTQEQDEPLPEMAPAIPPQQQPPTYYPISPFAGPNIPSIANFNFEPATPSSPTATHNI